jgi:hypothetical protein
MVSIENYVKKSIVDRYKISSPQEVPELLGKP